jgi:FAD/FMN-containing dehydrogenase
MGVKEDLIKIVGEENFSDSREALATFSKDYILTPPWIPHYLVKPKDVQEIQGVIKLADRTKTPIVPCSSAVHLYGDAIPKEGGIILDLTRMNKILEIDEQNRRVRIEPGVTWQQIEDELEKQELRVITPLLPHPQRSVVTDCLEGDFPLIPIYEYGELIEGCQVVWANGDIFRTGSASVPGYPESPAKGTNPEGPGINFVWLLHHAQGTMGIASWANVKIEYLPKLNKTFFITFDNLEEAIELVYRIQRLRIGQECFLLNSINLATILAEDWSKDFEALRNILPPWTLILILSGPRRRPEERIAYEERALMELKRQGFPKLVISTALPGVPGAGTKLLKMLRKPWTDEITYWKHRYKGRSQDLFFITKLALAQGFIKAIEEVAVKHGYPVADIGGYLQPVEQARACHLEFNFYYDPDDSKGVNRVTELYNEAARVALSMGALFERPYGTLADLVYNKAASYTIALKRVKRVFDPNNIMNPGNLCF